MTLAEQQHKLYEAVNIASHNLRSIPGVNSGSFGITPMEVKKNPAYISAKREYDRAFNALRDFNAKFARTIHK